MSGRASFFSWIHISNGACFFHIFLILEEDLFSHISRPFRSPYEIKKKHIFPHQLRSNLYKLREEKKHFLLELWVIDASTIVTHHLSHERDTSEYERRMLSTSTSLCQAYNMTTPIAIHRDRHAAAITLCLRAFLNANEIKLECRSLC